jgi:hypothetical protein
MPGESILEIEDSFVIRGRGLALVPKAFLFVTPNGVPKPFSDNVEVVKQDGTREYVEARFQIEHFSVMSENGGISGRFSLILLLPGKSRDDVPNGSQIHISESTLASMKSMVRWS